MNPQNDNPLPFPGLDLIFVEGGIFTMGDNNGQYDHEKPEHEVKVSSFYMGKYQVTQRLWQAVMGSNPSNFKGDNRPVEKVSWLDAQEFIKKLNSKKEVQYFLRKLDPPGAKLHLPTEAEWEFAARGGIYSQGYDYCGSDKLKQVGWYRENSNDQTHDAGLMLANELGIYDMSGNVREWCEDWFDEKFYEKCRKQGVVENPVNTVKGVVRVLRGGGFFFGAVVCRLAGRDGSSLGSHLEDNGLRLALSLQSVG